MSRLVLMSEKVSAWFSVSWGSNAVSPCLVDTFPSSHFISGISFHLHLFFATVQLAILKLAFAMGKLGECNRGWFLFWRDACPNRKDQPLVHRAEQVILLWERWMAFYVTNATRSMRKVVWKSKNSYYFIICFNFTKRTQAFQTQNVISHPHLRRAQSLPQYVNPG